MSNLTDFIGGSGKSSFFGGARKEITITANTTYVAPYTGSYLIGLVAGAGGGGGGSTYGGSGGGGAGIVYKIVELTKGENVSVTIGIGGAGGGANSAGSAGSISSFGSYFSNKAGGAGGVSNTSGTGGSGVDNGGDGGVGANGTGTGVGYTVPNSITLTFAASSYGTKSYIGGNEFGINNTHCSGGGAGYNGNGGNCAGIDYGGGGGGGAATAGDAGSSTTGGKGSDGLCIVVEAGE